MIKKRSQKNGPVAYQRTSWNKTLLCAFAFLPKEKKGKSLKNKILSCSQLVEFRFVAHEWQPRNFINCQPPFFWKKYQDCISSPNIPLQFHTFTKLKQSSRTKSDLSNSGFHQGYLSQILKSQTVKRQKESPLPTHVLNFSIVRGLQLSYTVFLTASQSDKSSKRKENQKKETPTLLKMKAMWTRTSPEKESLALKNAHFIPTELFCRSFFGQPLWFSVRSFRDF